MERSSPSEPEQDMLGMNVEYICICMYLHVGICTHNASKYVCLEVECRVVLYSIGDSRSITARERMCNCFKGNGTRDKGQVAGGGRAGFTTTMDKTLSLSQIQIRVHMHFRYRYSIHR